MIDMREWNDLVLRLASIRSTDDSIAALLNTIVGMLNDMSAQSKNEDLADMAWALRNKTEAIVDAIAHKPRSISLPDRS